jgi:hypothetical protein
MKLFIKKKNQKIVPNENGGEYHFNSLWVSTENKDDANQLVVNALENGVTKEAALKFIKANEYNGKTTYQFNLKCSDMTFVKVAQYGVLDLDVSAIKISTNKSGFTEAVIRIEERLNKQGKLVRVELINNYIGDFENADEWISGAPEATAPQHQGDVSNAEPNQSLDVDAPNVDLPF